MKSPHLPNYFGNIPLFLGLSILFILSFLLLSPAKASAQWCEVYPEGCTTTSGQDGTMMCYKLSDSEGSCSIWSHCDDCVPDQPPIETCNYYQSCNYHNLGSDSGYQYCTGTWHGDDCQWDETGRVSADCGQCYPLTCTNYPSCETPKFGPDTGIKSCTGVWQKGSCDEDSSGGVDPNCSSCRLTCDDITPKTYCNGNKIYKRTDCEDLFDGKNGRNFPGEFIQDCKTIEPDDTQDWSCQGGRGAAKCIKNYEIKIEMPTLLIGEENTINIRGTKSCKPKDPDKDITFTVLGGLLGTTPDDGFVNTSKFEQKCTLKYRGGSCDQNGDKPCLWQITCTPTRKDEEGVTHDFNFKVTDFNLIDLNDPRFTLDGYQFAGISGNLCKESTQYSIGARRCTPKAFIKDPQGSKSAEIIDKYLDSTATITGEMVKALLPSEIKDELTRYESAPMPDIGVQTGFFGEILENLRRLICYFRSLPLIGNLFWCRTELNFHNTKTEVLTLRSKTISAGERPPEVVPTPSQKSCYLEDVENSKGNQMFNLINSSISTRSGVYPIGLPEESRKGVQVNEASNSVSLHEYVIRDDLRSPDITCDQELFYIANYPKGVDGQIKPLFKPIQGWNNCLEKAQNFPK